MFLFGNVVKIRVDLIRDFGARIGSASTGCAKLSVIGDVWGFWNQIPLPTLASTNFHQLPTQSNRKKNFPKICQLIMKISLASMNIEISPKPK